MEETPVQKFQLASESELRLETLPDQAVTVRLLNGTAELFGTELAKDVEYSLADAAAIYTWHGCSLGMYEPSPAPVRLLTRFVQKLKGEPRSFIYRTRRQCASISTCIRRLMHFANRPPTALAS